MKGALNLDHQPSGAMKIIRDVVNGFAKLVKGSRL